MSGRPIEIDDEMAEHAAELIAERFGGLDHEYGWDSEAVRAREIDWARALVADVLAEAAAFSTSHSTEEDR